MTAEISLSLAILSLAVILFITEKLRVDVVALLVLIALAISNLVTPEEALSGFSNPAVVTVWAVFILSSGLSRTGVANVLGRQVLRLAGKGEVRLLVIIMLTAGVLSAFMNNVGVTAMLLPVVIHIARQTSRAPSKLLMPLAFGSLLGGLNTLIGTPPNILANNALRDFGLTPFRFFDFASVGLALTAAGILYMVLIGRRLLPDKDLARDLRFSDSRPGEVFSLQERLFFINIPANSRLAGKTLAQSRLGSALRLNVISIIRNGRAKLAPDPSEMLYAQDRLLVSGRSERLDRLGSNALFILEQEDETKPVIGLQDLLSNKIELYELTLLPGSSFVGKTISEVNFRQHFGGVVLSILRDGRPIRTDIQDVILQGEDKLLLQVNADKLEVLSMNSSDFNIAKCHKTEIYELDERLHVIQIPKDSTLAGKSLIESQLGEAFGLGVMGIMRNGETKLMPEPSEHLKSGDKLLVKGKLDDVITLRGLQDLKIDHENEPDLSALESEEVGLVEVVLSPHSSLAGKTLRQLHFREKYGLSILAIWRRGRAYRFNLRDMPLRFGDALLVHGPRSRLAVLDSEPDFIVLEQVAQETARTRKAPLATLIMAGVVISVGLGWLPIPIAAVSGATLMVLTGCIHMEEAYRSIEWQAIFLIAGMLPLGIAMENSGAASFLAMGVVSMVGGYGPTALMAGLFLLTTLAAQVMPNSVVLVLMAPIALNTAANLQLSPHALVMLVAMASSTIFLSPVSHPSNILVMGPGGYRFKDYFRVGWPMTLILLLVTLLVLPVFWPLSP
jgi:di/tricarboxylate transporter